MSTLRQVNSPWIEGYDFGVGVDLMSGSPMNLAVVDQHSNAGGAGATVGFRVSQVRSTSDLEQSLGIDVDASYGSVMFGAGVKARFDFAKSSAIQSTSLFMAVTATVQLAFESIDAPALTGTAGQTVDRQDIFEARFGNMFVRGMRHGGLFVGMMQVETQHEGDALGISGQLAGAYGFFSADVQAKFKQTIERFGASVFCTMY